MKNYKEKLEIYNSLSEQEKEWTAPNEYKNIDDEKILYSYIEYDKTIPIGFIDVYKLTDDPSIGDIVLAVKPKYRHKGIAKKLIKKALQAHYDVDEINLRYTVFSSNINSIRLINNFYYTFHFIKFEKGKIKKDVYVLNKL